MAVLNPGVPPLQAFMYSAPTVKVMRRAITLHKRRRAHWLYVTPDTLPNPWATLPVSSSWSEELAALGVSR